MQCRTTGFLGIPVHIPTVNLSGAEGWTKCTKWPAQGEMFEFWATRLV